LSRKQPCIGIADQKALSLAGWDISKALKKQVVRPFESLDELAYHYDIPRAALIRTVEEFNGYVESGKDLSFHKNILKDASPIQQPPYYAIRLWPKVHHVSGGIAINARAQVLDLDNNPIESLYAAGEVTGGTHGACRLGSCGTTECLVFGRIAGREAANR
jgi:succinate dehydrogenase/fumarate reductase flavoprotein subunit